MAHIDCCCCISALSSGLCWVGWLIDCIRLLSSRRQLEFELEHFAASGWTRLIDRSMCCVVSLVWHRLAALQNHSLSSSCSHTSESSAFRSTDTRSHPISTHLHARLPVVVQQRTDRSSSSSHITAQRTSQQTDEQHRVSSHLLLCLPPLLLAPFPLHALLSVLSPLL